MRKKCAKSILFIASSTLDLPERCNVHRKANLTNVKCNYEIHRAITKSNASPSININTRLSPVLESNSFVITCSCEIISLSTGTTTGYNGMETAGISWWIEYILRIIAWWYVDVEFIYYQEKLGKNIFILLAKNELISQQCKKQTFC